MTELIGIGLIIALIVVSAVLYLFVYYFRYRWQLKELDDENRRLLDQVLMLERENQLLRESPGTGRERQLGEQSTKQ